VSAGRQVVPAPARETVIGPGTVLEGHLDVQDSIRVDGHVRGRLSTPRLLAVGTEGAVEAELIEVSEARIEGRVVGRLRAAGQVYLAASAVLEGAIETSRLVVEEGAVLRPVDALTAPAPRGPA
jgi:cytoskeletal protein CcmA (bactofilin family)